MQPTKAKKLNVEEEPEGELECGLINEVFTSTAIRLAAKKLMAKTSMLLKVT